MKRPQNIKRIGIFLIFLQIAITAPLPAAPDDTDQYGTIILNGLNESYALGRHLRILEDASGAMTIREASAAETGPRYARSREASPSFGFNNSDYWLRFAIKNGRGRDETFFLELDYPHMDLMEVYYKNAAGTYVKKSAGDINHFSLREMNYRNFVFSLPVKKDKELGVYLHFSGKCSKQFSLTLYSTAGLLSKINTENLIFGIYYGFVIVMSLYNLFLFFFIRDKSYLYYFIYIASYGLVQMAYNGLAYQLLWPALPVWHNISLPFLIGWAILWMAIFSQSFLHTKEYTRAMHWLMRGIMGIGIAVMIYSLFGPYLMAIQAAMLLMLAASFMIMTSACISMIRGYRPARFFLIAWLFFLCGLVLIALNKLHALPVMFITEYANQIGSAVEVTLLSVALADRINLISMEKRQAQLATIQAQEKYKLIVEGSNDIVFSLDENLNFLSINQALLKHIKISPETLIGSNFRDLMQEEADVGSVGKKLTLEKLEDFLKSKKPVSLKVMFKSSIATEGKEMQVRLEYVNIEGSNEILGKATSLEEDMLLRYFRKEKQAYSIQNFLTLADDITRRTTRNLSKFMDQKQIILLRIALREIIINSIEHGNLNISYTEKTDAIINNTYFEFVAKRRQDPRYRDRHVHIEYQINSEEAVFKITDEGEGFEHWNVLDNNSREANDELLPHGRGISLAKNIFDEVKYNKTGNQVLLVKKINRRA